MQVDVLRIYNYTQSVVHFDVYFISLLFLIAISFSLQILSLRKIKKASKVGGDSLV